MSIGTYIVYKIHIDTKGYLGSCFIPDFRIVKMDDIETAKQKIIETNSELYGVSYSLTILDWKELEK